MSWIDVTGEQVDSRGMVSRPEAIPFRLFMTCSEPTKEEVLERLTALEEDNQRPQKENEQLREENERLREENKRFRAKLQWHEGPDTPPNKKQLTDDESSSSPTSLPPGDRP